MTKPDEIPKKLSSIILVNSVFDIDKLKKINNDDSTIISFDYTSHKILTENGVEHELSDNFLTSEDTKKIQQNSYRLTKWYDDSTVSSMLTYEGINLGRLFYVEFHYFLLPLLKKFIEITRICKKYGQKQLLATFDLYDIAKLFNTNTVALDEKKQEDFVYDHIKIPIAGSLNVTLKRSHYQYVKRISETIIQNLVEKQKQPKKAVLLIEFDPVRYENLLSLSPKIGVNFVLFNRRRPAIWNLQSYSIIKKSNTFVATDQNLVTQKIQEKIKNKQNELAGQLHSLWKNDDYFAKFFYFESSFWNIIKSNFKELCEKRIMEAVREIEITKELFQNHDLNCIMTWSESGFNEQIAIHLAKKLSIKIVLLQHGIIVDDSQAYEFNKFSGVIPIHSDKFVVWGETVKQYAVECGVPEEKIHVLGSPTYDKIAKNSDDEKNIILLAATAPRKIHVEGHLVNELENYENLIMSICKIVRLNNKKLIVKTHPFQEEHDITAVVKSVNPTIDIVKKGNILSLVKKCDCLISVGVSSAIFETQLVGKPVISLKVEYDVGTPSILKTDSCLKTSVDELDNVIKKIEDKEYRNNVISNASKLLSQNLANAGNASKELLLFLKKLETQTS